MVKGDTNCKYLEATNTSSATDSIYDHHESYKYYCRYKKKEIILPCICMRHCGNYEPIGEG